MATETTEPDVVASFNLAGVRWIVKLGPLSEMGRCEYDTYTIMLRESLSPQAMATTFYHELVHAILYTMGKIQHDEEFVDTFGGFLHQFDTTYNEAQ